MVTLSRERIDVGGYIAPYSGHMPERLRFLLHERNPRQHPGDIFRLVTEYLPSDLAAEFLNALSAVWVISSTLRLSVIRGPEAIHGIPNTIEDYGIVSNHVVTTAGVNKLVAGLNATDTSTFSIFKFHGIGTGTTAEAIGDTALVTELTTEYSPDNTRVTGNQTTGGSNNIYRTAGTNTLDGTPGAALREHGAFSNATVGSGTLLDRSLYSAITLSSGDGLNSQYDLTVAAGS